MPAPLALLPSGALRRPTGPLEVSIVQMQGQKASVRREREERGVGGVGGEESERERRESPGPGPVSDSARKSFAGDDGKLAVRVRVNFGRMREREREREREGGREGERERDR